MVKYTHNVNSVRWLVGNPERLHRTGVDGKPFRCPFCPGAEADTPPETYRIGNSVKDGPGWQVRVVPNKFNITDIHEVVIHSPDHDKSIDELPLSQVELIIQTYIQRYGYLKDHYQGQVYIFSNFALSSGASLIHPHSQIVVVPPNVKTNTLELQPVVNIVEQNNSFVSYCPEFSEWPYEIWITENSKLEVLNTKQKINTKFENLNDNQIKYLASILQSSIIKIKKIHDKSPQFSKRPFGYNFYIFIPQSCPERAERVEGWYLRIIPRFIERAGFELSTRIMVNSVSSKQASEELKKI